MSRRDLLAVFLTPFIIVAIIATVVTLGGTALLTTIAAAETSWGMSETEAKLLVVPVGLSFMIVIGVAAWLAGRKHSPS
ncbi:MAG: hypothetical protein IT307_05045 [Chloroflexi bacterium]|nr:hypothetical protein [Chloroflexota bacterium]